MATAKKAAEAVPAEQHDWSEFETRAYKIDHLLAEAGWRLNHVRDREFEVHGMPTASGVGYVDYVLWGDDGRPLGLVEAKKTLVAPAVGQQQAKLYADCLEQATGQRPVTSTGCGTTPRIPLGRFRGSSPRTSCNWWCSAAPPSSRWRRFL